MSQMQNERVVHRSSLPGAAVLRGVRRLILLALVASIIYSTLATSSMGTCPGGFDSSGGFIDADGNPVAVAPSCITLTLGPNPLLFVVFALIGIGALSSALKKSKTDADALRYINAAAIVIVVITVVCLVVSHFWFWTLPLEQWDGTGDFFLFGPFPFAVMTTEISPMVG